ncbi:MAG: PDZ domain-containing protein [Chthoniobacterales bacterium]
MKPPGSLFFCAVLLLGVSLSSAQEYNQIGPVYATNGMVTVRIGNLCGIGAVIRKDKESGKCEVREVVEGLGAEKAGVKSGDIISKIDGEDIAKWDAEKTVEKLRGNPDTKVRLTILRGSEKPFDITVTRQVINLHEGIQNQKPVK